MSDSEIDALITEATKGIPRGRPGIRLLDQESRKAVAERLNVALRTAKLRARPNFPEEWRTEPNVMFDSNDPRHDPFDWGRPKWATEQAYYEDLALFLGDLACAADVPEALTRGVARRAMYYSSDYFVERPDRIWVEHLAPRLIGPECPPAKGLPNALRNGLEQLSGGGSE